MILKNILLVVRDIERSRKFYQEILGLSVTADMGKKVMLTGGIVLEESSLWEDALRVPVEYGSNNAELYFEDSDIEGFQKRLERSDHKVEFLMSTDENLSEVLRFYDPDQHVIEVKKSR